MKIRRKIIEINEELCTGCGECVPSCAEGSLKIVDGKVRLVAENLCDGLGACLGSCPTGALMVIERDAEDFDEEAVKKFLAEKSVKKQASSGCPSAQIRMSEPSCSCSCEAPARQTGSALGHWPIQIRLVPPGALFLENRDLLIVADCAAVACGSLQQDFVKDRAVMMGCPKFDDQQLYVDRFTELFQTRKLKSVTILIMEVPCCSAMLQIVRKAWSETGIPVRQVVLSTQGLLLDDRAWQQN